MGIGFGALKQMNDTIRANREMLGKKKSVRELYREEIKNRKSSSENQSLEEVRARVAYRLKRGRTKEVFVRITSGLIVILIIGSIVWIIFAVDLGSNVKGEKNKLNKNDLFKTILYENANGMVLKVDYYHSGPKAAETLMKKNLRHQNSESYYESGEQFRSALYYYDTLVRELFFFKTGDTIKNFPIVDVKNVVKVSLVDEKIQKKIEFHIYDNKILQDSYKESDYAK